MCDSRSMSTILAVSVIITALLAMIVFVLVQIAVCKCHLRSTPGPRGAEIGTSEGGEGQVDGDEGGVTVSDPTYTEIGVGGEHLAFELMENKAYHKTTIAVGENEAYGLHL